MFVAFRRELQEASEVIDQFFDRKPHLRIGAKGGYRLIEVPHDVVGAAGSIVEKTAEAIARGQLRGVSRQRHHVGRVWHRHDCSRNTF